MRKKHIISVTTLLCGILLTACGGSKTNSQAPVKYETQILKPESRIYNEYIPASLHGINEVDVYPQVSGIIREMKFTDGFKVERGQTLFVIDQTEHQLKVQNARANLAAAQAEMDL